MVGFPKSGHISDGGTSFLSKLMKEVHKLLGLKTVNLLHTYHPQTDEQFNHALTNILLKKIKQIKKIETSSYCTSCFVYISTHVLRTYYVNNKCYYTKLQIVVHKTILNYR